MEMEEEQLGRLAFKNSRLPSIQDSSKVTLLCAPRWLNQSKLLKMENNVISKEMVWKLLFGNGLQLSKRAVWKVQAKAPLCLVRAKEWNYSCAYS